MLGFHVLSPFRKGGVGGWVEGGGGGGKSFYLSPRIEGSETFLCGIAKCVLFARCFKRFARNSYIS